MKLKIRPEVIPFIGASLSFGLLLAFGLHGGGLSWCIRGLSSLGVTAILCGYFLFFFRDPERIPPLDETLIVSGADGIVTSVTEMYEGKYLNTNCVRISVFLSLFDVHVNRAPIGGNSTFLGYFPGKHFFTFSEKSSEFNQHNKILIEGTHVRCLVNQIVGPICRRVVYWLDHEKPQEVKPGIRIGMMKFGSRLDMMFPKDDVRVLVAPGQRVKAGETVIASATRTSEAREIKHDDQCCRNNSTKKDQTK